MERHGRSFLLSRFKNSEGTSQISRDTGNHPRYILASLTLEAYAYNSARAIFSSDRYTHARDMFHRRESVYRVPLARDLLPTPEGPTLRGYSLLRIRYFAPSDVVPGVISRDLPRRLLALFLPSPRPKALLDPPIPSSWSLVAVSRSGSSILPACSSRTDPHDHTNFHEIT